MRNKGQVLIIAIIFLAVILILASTLFSRVAGFLRSGSGSILREQATHLAEAGVDNAIWQLNKTAGSCPSPYCGTEQVVGTTGSFIVTIADKTSTLKTVTSTGYVPNTTSPRAKRTVKVDVAIDSTTIAFGYAAQVGNDGLDMENSSIINGTVYSNGNIVGSGSSSITGDAYAVGTISTPDPSIGGLPHPSASPIPLPTINSGCDLQCWKDRAAAGGTESTNCTISTSTTIGPKKYDCSLSLTNNAVVTMNGPLWVTGNFSMSQGGTTLKLNDSFGSLGTTLIVEGIASLNQGGSFQSTNANPKGYILLATTSTADPAISLSQSGATAIFYALNGGAELFQSATVVTLVANQLHMRNSASLNYDTGLASAQFTSGPGGSWTVKKGTYRFTSSP